MRLALEKALAAAARFPGALALGADTVVAVGDQTLGKPSSPDDAVAMLKRLRGRSHQVITGIGLARVNDPDDWPESWHRTATTQVWMRDYTDAEIEEYVATGDPLDKAGSYAIQHTGFHPVERLEGCYLAVVGLPVPQVTELLATAGCQIPIIARETIEPICPGCTDFAPTARGLIS